MELYHVGDPHLGHRQYGLTQRERDTQLTLESVLTAAREDDAAAVLIPGDFFDTRDLRPQILWETEATLKAAGDVPVIVSPGNHDQNLTPRRLTWLNYLHKKGQIVLLSADLSGEVARFDPVDRENPTVGGGGYVDFAGPNGPVRIFGLQYQGGYTDTALTQTAAGIHEVNEHEDDPAVTVLMAHFGLADVVPDLGGTVNHTELTPLEDIVDYLALGHVHKKYESAGWVFNPGSIEAHDVQEGGWKDAHGYYVVDIATPDEDGRSYSVEHRLSRRRPYYHTEFCITDYPSYERTEHHFRDHVASEQDSVESECERTVFTADGDRRKPIIDLRLTGTLAYDRSRLNTERLREIAADELDALYVQLSDQAQSKAIQDLLGDLDADDVFNEKGTLNRELLEGRVFSAIAAESEYNARAPEVASLLQEVSAMVGKRGEPIADVAELVKARRRKLFPNGAEMATGDAEAHESSEPAIEDVGEEAETEATRSAADGGADE